MYEGSCKTCHGLDGKGNQKVADMLKVDLSKLDLTDDETTKKKDAELANAIFNGAGKMKGYRNKFSDPDVNAIVSHIRSLQK